MSTHMQCAWCHNTVSGVYRRGDLLYCERCWYDLQNQIRATNKMFVRYFDGSFDGSTPKMLTRPHDTRTHNPALPEDPFASLAPK